METTQKRINEIDNLFEKLVKKEIRPSEIVGTGLKNPRECAFVWLYETRINLLKRLKNDN